MARTFRAMRNARFGSGAQVGQSADSVRVGQPQPSSRQRRRVIALNSVLTRAMDYGPSGSDGTSCAYAAKSDNASCRLRFFSRATPRL